MKLYCKALLIKLYSSYVYPLWSISMSRFAHRLNLKWYSRKTKPYETNATMMSFLWHTTKQTLKYMRLSACSCQAQPGLFYFILWLLDFLFCSDTPGKQDLSGMTIRLAPLNIPACVQVPASLSSNTHSEEYTALRHIPVFYNK